MAEPNPFAFTPQVTGGFNAATQGVQQFFYPDAVKAEVEQRRADQLFNADLSRRMRQENGVTLPANSTELGLNWGVLPTLPKPVSNSQSARPSLNDRINWRESRGNNGVVGPANKTGERAQGGMQVLPSTAREVAKELGIPYDPMKLLSDRQYNRQIGDGYIAKLNKMFGGNETLVSAAYNAGPGTVSGWLKSIGDPRSGKLTDEEFARRIPYKETRDYVKEVVFSDKFSGRSGSVPQGSYAPNADAYAPVQLRSVDPNIAKNMPKPRRGQNLDLPDAAQQARLGDAPQMALRNLEEEMAMMAALRPREKTGYDFLTSAMAQAAQAAAAAQGQSLGALIGSAGGAFGGTYQGAKGASETEQQQFLMELLNERFAGEQANRQTADMNALRVDTRAGQNNTIDFNNANNQNDVLGQEILFNTGIENQFRGAMDARDSNMFNMLVNLEQGLAGTANQQTMANSGLGIQYDQAKIGAAKDEFAQNFSVDQYNTGLGREDDARTAQQKAEYLAVYKGLSPAGVNILTRAGMPAHMQLGVTPAEDAQIRTFAEGVAMGNVPVEALLSVAMNEPGFKKGLDMFTGVMFDNAAGANEQELMANRLALLKRTVNNSKNPQQTLDTMLSRVQSENPILKIYRAR